MCGRWHPGGSCTSCPATMALSMRQSFIQRSPSLHLLAATSRSIWASLLCSVLVQRRIATLRVMGDAAGMLLLWLGCKAGSAEFREHVLLSTPVANEKSYVWLQKA